MMKYSFAFMQVLTLSALMAVAGAALPPPAYPSKPIRLIVPFSAGGGSDMVARVIASKLTESWGQQVIVDNRPGGNTMIGTDIVAKSPPDGYTLLVGGTSHVTTPSLFTTPFDAVKDFAGIATVSSGELILALNPAVPANNLREFIAYAKSKPGQLNYATYGSGSASHLGTEMFGIMVGVKMQHIPYKGAGPAATDLIGGQVPVFLSTPPPVIPHIRSGRAKAVAISGEHRLSALPQVPTFTEAGLPGFDVRNWVGMLAPAGTPKTIVDKLSLEISRIVALPFFKEKLDTQGWEPFVSTPEQFAALMKADMAKWAKVIKTANIKVDQ